MKLTQSVLLIAFFVFFVFAGTTYGLMRYLQKESIELAVAREIEEFKKDFSAANSLYFSFGLLAHDLFTNDSANIKIIDNLLAKQDINPISFIKSARDYFSSFQKSVSRLNIDFIHLHSKDAKSFLRIGKVDGYGDNLKKTRPDVVYVQKTRVPIQSYELGKHGLLLRNIFPLNNFNEVKSIEFSSTLSKVLETMRQFSGARYGAYTPLAKMNQTMHALRDIVLYSSFLKEWVIPDATSFNEDYLKSLTKKEQKELEYSMKEGLPFGAFLRDKQKIQFFAAIPIFSAVDERLLAYVVKIHPSDEVALIEQFFFRYYLLALFFIFMFVVFGYWMWHKKTYIQSLYESLASQKSEIETLVKHAKCGIASIDKDGNVIQGNEEFAHLVGVEHHLLKKQNFFTLIGAKQAADMKKSLLGEQKSSLKQKFKNLSNISIEMDTFSSNIPGKDSISLIVVSRKEKKALENALRRLNLYFNHSDLGHMILDENLIIINVNESLCNILGCRRDEILTKPIKKLFATEEFFKNWQNESKSSLVGDQKERIEYRLRRKDGAFFWAEMFGNNFEDGTISQSIWSIRDVSKAVNSRNLIARLNKRLKEQFEELEETLNIIPMPIMIKDENFIYKWCNETFYQFFNLERSVVIGKKTKDIFPKEFSETSKTKDIQMRTTSFLSYKKPLVDPVTKEERVIEFHKKRITKDGLFGGIIGVAVDITDKEKQKTQLEERVRAEVEKNIQALKLYEEDKIKDAKFSLIGKMAAEITHEINTPLTYVKGNIEIHQMDIEKVQNKVLRNSMEKDISIILEGIERIANIIESMRQSSQKSTEEPEYVNIYETLINALKLCFSRIKQIAKVSLNDLVFNLDLPKDGEIHMTKGRRQRLEQVWIVVISNALDELVKIEDFEKRGLQIRIWEDERNINVSFEDNAGGIHPDILPQIFDPFVSLKDSFGIGVGLNIAQRIIKNHNGEIYASNTNEGALFKICLPKESGDVSE